MGYIPRADKDVIFPKTSQHARTSQLIVWMNGYETRSLTRNKGIIIQSIVIGCYRSIQQFPTETSLFIKMNRREYAVRIYYGDLTTAMRQ